MEFTLNINCDNAAFEDSPHDEIARILRELADKMGETMTGGKVRDYNGNTVGEWTLA